MPQFVDIETPYAGGTEEQIRKNILYARACVRDSLMRGEIPFASHILYTQPGITDDTIIEERNKGIDAGRTLIESLPNAITVIYQDLGISGGMKGAIERANKSDQKVEYRTLGEDWEEKELKIARKHAHKEIWGFK